MQIQISWLLQKPTDLDLHCLLKQGMSWSEREGLSFEQLCLEQYVDRVHGCTTGTACAVYMYITILQQISFIKWFNSSWQGTFLCPRHQHYGRGVGVWGWAHIVFRWLCICTLYIRDPMRLRLTLVLLNPDIPCLCKQCRSRSVGFSRSQLIWICTVCHTVYEFISTIWIKLHDWVKIRSGHGILIYSARQVLRLL